MPKKTTILIVILAVITGVLIFLAIRSDQGQQLLNIDTPTPTPNAVQPFAQVAFASPTVDASTGPTTQSVDVLIDSAEKPVAGVQLELSYDPNALTNVSVKTPTASFFGENPSVLISSVDPEQGRISYAVGISATEAEKAGRGTVATITFTVNRQSGLPSTSITFLPKSAVTTLSAPSSVLSSVSPLQIQILPAQ